MYDPNSPILDFYPLEFEQDLNGKKQDWEAIVKIPFIDEERLLKAMAGTHLARVWSCGTKVYFQCQLVIIVSPRGRENGTLGARARSSVSTPASPLSILHLCPDSSPLSIDARARWSLSISRLLMGCISFPAFATGYSSVQKLSLDFHPSKHFHTWHCWDTMA
jgi:hypothetical protein